MNKFCKLIGPLLLLTALAVGNLAVAQDEEPLRPEDAYRYVVIDTGDAIEVDWAIEDGYYLYRNKLGFESNTPGVDLGEPQLPEGLPHEDEFFGKQQVYRDHFFVSVPYQVEGARPDTLEFVLKSQGCWDGGLCYPPQKWTETVELRTPPATTKAKLDLGSLGGLGGSEFLPVDEAFKPILIPVDGNTVEVTFQITPGYYLYKEKIAVAAVSDNVQLGKLDLPKGKLKYDEFFGESEVYFDDVFASLPLARATPEAMTLELEVEFQGCAEGGLCYPPTTRIVSTSLPAASVVTDLAALPPRDEPISEQGKLARVIVEGNFWAVIATFFGLGLLLAFTPCVLPMIPILTAIIAGEGKDTSPTRGFVLALSYVIGMAIVYTAAGVIAVAAGAQVQATFNQPWVLTVFAGLFVLLAIAMFGGYDLQMPSSIQSRLAGLSNNQKSGTVVGAFIMGALSSLIVTACVAPALVAALAVMAQTGDYLRGGMALFAMSLGMGAPLLAVGAAQGKFLPKAGMWMVAVKSAFGFMMLGLAIWMLSRILPGSLTLGLWAALVFMTGVFMGGLTTLTTDSNAAQKLGKGFGLLAILYGLLLFLGALTGGSNPLKPLATLRFNAGVMVAEERHLEFRRIKTVDDLDREIAAAAAAGKTAMLDFYADWCVSCIEMEEYTFTDAGVQATLANTVLLQADVTANDEADQALLKRFGVFGPPTIIFFGTDGQQRHGYEVVGYMKAKDFAQHVQKAFDSPAAASMSTQAH
ncbi:MAG: protein-disulfide reductase DsbD [Gammaproteobacteria bacterium]|nr:protein-disulfide reductase DsbD [Gammaproteobacteria bacterium]MDH3431882.1 protein-disulfide reductase DsbD [Gammaproteobacteria bacterium]